MIYFIQRPSDRAIKIGHTLRLNTRLRDLEKLIGEPLAVLAIAPGERKKEQQLHKLFEDSRISGEWFKPTGELLSYIKRSGRHWDGSDEVPVIPSQSMKLPADDMDRVRRAGRSIGLSLSAFIRQAVLEKTVDVEKRMGPSKAQ